MASPFKFFRKYSGGMMVIMVILSMLLFTLTDLFMDPGANLWLLGILVGGAVFGIAGIGQGRWLQWGAGGAILGAALGVILPSFVEGNGLSSSLGVIDEEEIYNLEVRRAVANQFIMRATEATFGEGTARFASVFGFGHRSDREDVIFGKLLRAEADRLGITVNDRMVQEYLNRVMGDKLTKENYIKTRNEIPYQQGQLDDPALISILADEIKAQMAYQTLRPRTSALPPGPEVYWEYFRRLNVRQQLELAALDVDAFLDQVGEPSDTEVQELFAKHQKQFPNQLEAGSPGFRLPFRASLAYLELDSKSIESELGEVTEADIETYYNENKETPLIRRPVIPDFDDDSKPPEESKTEPPAEEKAADEEKSDPAEPTAPKPATPAPASPDEKPATDADKPKPSEGDAEPADPKPAAATEEPAKDDSPEADDKTPTEEAAPVDDSCASFESDESQEDSEGEAAASADEPQPPAAQESAASEKPSDAEPPAATAKDEKSEESKPADSEAAAKPDAAKPDAAKPDEADDDKGQPADAKPPAAPPTLTIPDVPSVPAAGTSPSEREAPKMEYEYKELDDELKAEIREEIVRQRVKAAIDDRMSKAVAYMETLARARSKERFTRIEKDPRKYEGRDEQQQKALRQLREEMQPYDQEISAEVKKYAQDNGFAYVATSLLSYADLLEDEDNPIGRATEPNDNPLQAAQSPPVAQTVFQSFSADEQNNDAQLFLVRRAQRTSSGPESAENHYAYWAVDFSPSHVPTLDEPGVRDTVVLEWKRQKARDLVLKRGEELARQIRDGLAAEGEQKQTMETVLKDETVSGTDSSAPVAVRRTLPFSWLRTSQASPMNFQQQQAVMSPIEFEDSVGSSLERVGEDFMQAVFADMQDEEVSVVPNADLSKYYIVHTTNRFPTPEIGEDGLRERFATEGQQFAFARSPVIGVMQQQLQRPAAIEWERGVWLRYGIDPDSEPDEE